MKKKIPSLLLALVLCLGLLPSAAFATTWEDIPAISLREAAEDYGIVFDVEELDFGAHVMQESDTVSDVWATRSFTVTNRGDTPLRLYQIGSGFSHSSLGIGSIEGTEFSYITVAGSMEALFQQTFDTTIAPGDSATYSFDLHSTLGLRPGLKEPKFHIWFWLEGREECFVDLPCSFTFRYPTFGDNGAISSWATDAVGQMQASGIMGGVGDNRFSPQGTYSWEQSIATLMRLYDMTI